MAYTADDLAAIRRAIATGERTVQYADRRVEFRSMSELMAAEKNIAAALTPAIAPLGGRTWACAQSGKGL